MTKVWMRDGRSLTAWAAIGLVIAISGCKTEVTQDQNKQEQSKKIPEDSSSTKVDSPEEEVTVSVVDGAGYRAILEKRLGNVVLVDYWATW